MKQKWREFTYQVRGKSHDLNGKPGQDRVQYSARNGVKVICLADGAGSAQLSEHGAQAVVQAGCELVADLLADGKEWDAEFDPRAFHAYLIDQLKGVAARLGCGLKDLASTFLCLAITDSQYVALQIGDGVIGASCNGELEAITLPDNGEFSNITTFVTSVDALHSLQVKTGSLAGYEAFILMSDGTADALFNHDALQLAPACHTLFQILSDAPTRQVANPIHKKDLKRIMDQQIREATEDDCSIGILALSS